MAACREELSTESGARLYGVPAWAPPRAARPGRAAIRRRRLALGFLLGAVVAGTVAGGGPRGTAAASKDAAPGTVVVAPGGTLWDLAARYARPGVDPRAYVDAVMRLNDLDGGLAPGMRVRLPR